MARQSYDYREVLAYAKANSCRFIYAKPNGIYFASSQGYSYPVEHQFW